METLTKNSKKLSLTIMVDKLSNHCISDNGDFKVFDETLLLHNFAILKDAGCEGHFTFKYKSVSDAYFNKVIVSDNKWISSKKVDLKQNVLLTMFKNKGII